MNARQRTQCLLLLVAACGCGGGGASGNSGFTIALGTASAFGTHAQFKANGFAWGLPDGTMGALANGDGTYSFFGAGGSSSTCAGSPNVEGAYRFTGSLDHLTGLPASECKVLFAKGSAPSGWVFDKDYAGGGSVVPFQSGTTSGLLMAYHGEVHWTISNGNGLCGNVPCFYGAIGLAVSTDGGATFKSVGQIVQAYQPLSAYQGGSRNIGIGYGSWVVADAAGNWLATPPTTPSSAYLYVFYEDYDPSGPGTCAYGACVAVARARFDEVVAAALSNDSSTPATVAGLFRKYDSGASDPWSQRGASGDPTENTASGHFTPLFSDGNSFLPSVIWDTVAHAYLMVHQRHVGGTQPTHFIFRSSTDLLHWSLPLATYAPAAGPEPFYPTFLGEGETPLVGAAAPRLFFGSFAPSFPIWANSELNSLPLSVTQTR